MANASRDKLDESHPQADVGAERLFRRLCHYLLKYGERPTGGSLPATGDDASLYCEVETPNFGITVISDAGVEENHWDYAGIVDKLPTRKQLLRASASILTLSYPDMTKSRDDRELWYFAARPFTLRAGSDIRRIYQQASRDSSAQSYNVAFFNESRIEASPADYPLFAEVGKVLKPLY